MTPVKSAADGFLHHDIKPGDAVAWPTNLGWMMGPWLIYASLINKASIALYYGVPTGRQFGQFVQDTGLAVLGLVPSLVRAWRTTDCMSGFDWSSLKLFSSTGECSSTDDMLFLMSLAGYRPVIEYCGGTEIGGGYITGTVVQPSAPATFSTPALGLDFVILDENGAETDNGEVFLAPPSIGLSQNLLNRDHHEEYFADAPPPPPRLSGLRTENDQDYEVKLRRHGDQAERLGGDYFRIHGRADDTMNLGGIKVSSAEIERTLNRIDDILETAAIGVPAPGGGPARLVVYTVLNPGSSISSDDLRKKMQTAIKQDLNPLFKVYKAVLVDSLPRTASNKVMRRILRKKYSQDNSE
jgi:acetyl-CoA synthetase